MPLEIAESDWKLLRKFNKSALEHYCQAIIEEAGRLCGGAPQNSHERFLQLYRLVEGKDKELGLLFDNMMRRSVAIEHICALRGHSLIMDEEFSQFSSDLQERINFLLNF